MQITFYKYQATGNDFIIIDNRSNLFDKNNTKLIEKLCDRRFGIGADGLILIEFEKNCDFKMIYFNSDGHQSTMCGNGGRCVVAFAKKIDLIKSEAFFLAIDGHHHAKIEGSFIELKMKNVTELKKIGDDIKRQNQIEDIKKDIEASRAKARRAAEIGQEQLAKESLEAISALETTLNNNQNQASVNARALESESIKENLSSDLS